MAWHKPLELMNNAASKKAGIKLQVIAKHIAVALPDANSDLLLVYFMYIYKIEFVFESVSLALFLCVKNVFLCGNRFHIFL